MSNVRYQHKNVSGALRVRNIAGYHWCPVSKGRHCTSDLWCNVLWPSTLDMYVRILQSALYHGSLLADGIKILFRLMRLILRYCHSPLRSPDWSTQASRVSGRGQPRRLAASPPSVCPAVEPKERCVPFLGTPVVERQQCNRPTQLRAELVLFGYIQLWKLDKELTPKQLASV